MAGSYVDMGRAVSADGAGSELENRVFFVAARVFDVDVKSLSMSDSPQTIDRWDSLNHLKLITAIEAEFGIRLKMQTVLKMHDIAAVVAAVKSQPEG